MSLNFKFKPSASSLYLDKFIKSQRNISKPSPRLFPADHPNTQSLRQTVPSSTVLDVSHYLLQKLDQSCPRIQHFHQIHSQLLLRGLFQHPLLAGRCIKKLCTDLNSIGYCVYLYGYIDEPDAFMCNTIMRGFLDSCNAFGALTFYYEGMVGKCVLPNHYTIPLVAKVCCEVGSVVEGWKAHARVFKLGFESDLFVKNAFIRLYSVCGGTKDACDLFDSGYVLDLVSWNSMIDGYVKNGQVGVARELFDEMSERDVFSWNSMISGYVAVGDMDAARGLFDRMPCRDVVSWNCMIEGYARVKNVDLARAFFIEMPSRNAVSWNIMLALYLRRKDYGECLKLFDKMVELEVKPNEASLVSILIASANFRKLERGKWVHSYIRDNGIEPDVLLSTALLTMYVKCGVMDTAREIFDQMPAKSVVSWNCMIMGYGMHVQGERALEIFLEMERAGYVPNSATFVSILSACSRSKLIVEGWWYFRIMLQRYKIRPTGKHQGCMVDLLSRAGLMDQAEELVKNKHTEGDPNFLRATHFNCSRYVILELGEMIAKQQINSYPEDITPYLLLLFINIVERKWDHIDNVRYLIIEKFGKQDCPNHQLGEFGFDVSLGKCSLHKKSMAYSMLDEISACIRLLHTESSGHENSK
ncbi:Pentatricopeptide repeat-containing protein At3g29230 [Linum grandiflorum]